MAVLILQEMTGMTQEQYEGVNKAMDFPNTVPDGLLSHTAAKGDGGMQVADVWESEDKFQEFIEKTLMPAVGQTDYEPVPATPTTLEVANRWPE